MPGRFLLLLVAALAPVCALTSACVARPRMCAQPYECGAPFACVAGRCQAPVGMPSFQEADDRGTSLVRRVVIAPTQIAFVRRGDAAQCAALPTLLTLGRASDGDALLFLRFALPLTKATTVVEAYLVLERTDVVDADPAPLSLHLARVVEAWDARSISWALQPRTEGARTPATIVPASGRGIVRLDARDLVSAWRLHASRDQGLAVVADNSTATGIVFASGTHPTSPYLPSPGPTMTQDSQAISSLDAARGLGPRLEVYLR